MYAINIAVLPPDPIKALAISLSNQLKDSSPLVLNKTSFLPHITIAMGYVSDLNLVRDKAYEAFNKVGSFEIVVDNLIHPLGTFNGYSFSYLTIRKNTKLQALHKDLMKTIPFLSVDTLVKGAFFTDQHEVIVPPVYQYVNAYKEKSSKQEYNPHITLGAGTIDDLTELVKLPLSFKMERINVCHIGNYCSCRAILI